MPHSIQAHTDGAEFLLAFDDDGFSENGTLLLSDFLRHMPPEVVAKYFGVDVAALASQPQTDLYIFEAPAPGPLPADRVPRMDPLVAAPQLSFKMSAMEYVTCPGGRLKIVDSRNFPVATIASALIEAAPGAMRELHWHPNADECQYFLEGSARMTVFATGNIATTFDYRAGDVGYVPKAMGPYVENTGAGRCATLPSSATGPARMSR